MDKINFNHLYYFFVVAKLGSIKEASTKLHVTQPTISDQIKLLEEYFECKLFERITRGLKLTKEGQVAVKYAEKIFDLGNELTSILRNKERGPKLSLDIGMTPFMSNYFLYEKILPVFKSGAVSVNIIENQRHLLLAELEKAKVDIVITDSRDGLSASMDAFRIGVNRSYAICHKDLLDPGLTFPECLNVLPFFNYTGESSLKYEIELFFAKHQLSPRQIGEGDSVELFQMVCDNKLGFCIVPEVTKNRICANPDIVVAGELTELQTKVYGVVKHNQQGIAADMLKKITI